MTAMEMAQARKILRAAVSLCMNRAGWTHDQVHAECERAVLDVVFRRAKGNQLRMAAELGVHRNTVRRRIDDAGLKIERGKGTRSLVQAA